jgi:hypothetical protein
MSEDFRLGDAQEQKTRARIKVAYRRKGRSYPCWLYLATDDFGLCKIGIADHVASRMVGIQQEHRRKFPDRHLINLRSRPYRAWQFTSRDEAYCVEQLTLWATRRHYAEGEWRWCEPSPLSVLISWIVKNLGRAKFVSNPNSSGFVTFTMQDLNVKLLHSAIMKRGGVRLMAVTPSAGATP